GISRSEYSPVRRKCDRYLFVLIGPRMHYLAGAYMLDPEIAVVADRRRQCAVRRQRSPNTLLVSRQPPQFHAGLPIPHPHRAIIVPRDDRAAIGAPANCVCIRPVVKPWRAAQPRQQTRFVLALSRRADLRSTRSSKRETPQQDREPRVACAPLHDRSSRRN